MTQRGAVTVGCRLIAVYVVFNTISETLFFMIGNSAGGPPSGDLIMRAGLLGILRAGVAVLLWVAAPRIARIAAEPEEALDAESGSDVR